MGVALNQYSRLYYKVCELPECRRMYIARCERKNQRFCSVACSRMNLKIYVRRQKLIEQLVLNERKV